MPQKIPDQEGAASEAEQRHVAGRQEDSLTSPQRHDRDVAQHGSPGQQQRRSQEQQQTDELGAQYWGTKKSTMSPGVTGSSSEV
jgi:hypothetical protein